MKAPAFQMYVKDWTQDTRPLSLAAKGAWADILMHLHLSRPRGRDTHTMDEWARIIGATETEAGALCAEIRSSKIATVTFRNSRVTVVSRRMWREWKAADGNAKRQARHRGKRGHNEKVTSLSASASASATAQPPPMSPKGECAGFDAFWTAYPRKVGKKRAEKAWGKAKAMRPLADILAAIETQKRTAQWLKEGGQFIPHPATWINDGRWADEGTESQAERFRLEAEELRRAGK